MGTSPQNDRMEIQEKYKIAGLWVPVLVVDATILGDDRGRLQTINGELTILLADNMGGQMRETTLIHEIFEAINFLFEIDLEHNKISTLEAAWYQVLKDNFLLKSR